MRKALFLFLILACSRAAHAQSERDAGVDAALGPGEHAMLPDGATLASDAAFPFEAGLPFLSDAQSAQAAVVAPSLPAPDVAPSVPTPAPAPAPIAATEVRVQARRSATEQLQGSAAAVTVVRLSRAKKRSADLGEVMSRIPGISIRRGGSLGSDFRLSLNGLQGSQVRTFLDGVPLSILYTQGFADMPINLLDHLEVYRGVVPVRLASDALGGALNFVRPERYESQLQGSYQVGSFGVHRATLAGRYRHDPSGFVAGLEGYFDDAKNDYEVDVQVPDERGRLSPARVKRFHDGFRAYGGIAELGVVDKPWAKKLILRGYYSRYRKELQHNIVMTVPYGEVRYGERAEGAMLRYEVRLFDRADLEVVGAYGHRTVDFVDKARWVYDWFGDRVRERLQRGEIQTPPVDQTVWEDRGFSRVSSEIDLVPGHALIVTASPDYVTRTGDERLQWDPNARDPLTAERRMFKMVAALEYRARFWAMKGADADVAKRRPEDSRIENSWFLKSYTYRAWSEELLPGDILKHRNAKKYAIGVGNVFRVYLTDWLLTKVSYEFATRMPDPSEMFGDAVLIKANLDLKPETTHNANLGPRAELKGPRLGSLIVDLNAFLRQTSDQIVLLGDDRMFSYQNVYRARSIGVEGTSEWKSPGRYVELQAALTFQELRNDSTRGTFREFRGDRLPNRPWLFGSWGAQLRFANLIAQGDELEPFYLGRYTHEFYRGWESLGLRAFKQSVDRMVSHNLGVTYGFPVGRGHLDVTIEATNLTDARLYDFFGVQRAGRAFFGKISGDLF